MKKSGLMSRLGSTLGARLLMAAVNFGLFWALSHSFDMSSLGTYSLLMNLFFMTLGLPLLGLAVPLERRAAASPETLASELSNMMVIALPMGALLMLGLGLYGQVSQEPEVIVPFWLLGGAVWVSAWIITAESALLGREQMGYIARVQCGEAVLRTALALAAVAAGTGLVGVMVVFLFLRTGTALLYLFGGKLPRPQLRWLGRAVFSRNLAELPVFFGIVTLAGVVSRLDLLVLDHFTSKAQVAIYTVSSRLYEASLMLPTAVALVLLPALARLFASDETRFSNALIVMLQGVLWIGMPVVLAVAALAGPVIDLLYPPEYAEAAGILRWLMLAGLLTAVDQVLSSAMIASHSQIADLRSMLLSIVTLCLCFALLIPFLGPPGVAISVALGLAARVAWRFGWVFKRLAPQGLASVLRKAGASGLAGVAGLLVGLPHGPWIALLLCQSGLLLGAILTGHLSRHPVRDFAHWRHRWAKGGLD